MRYYLESYGKLPMTYEVQGGRAPLFSSYPDYFYLKGHMNMSVDCELLMAII